MRDAFLGELVRGEPRPLEQRAGLVGVDELETAPRVQLPDDAEGGAPPGGREAPGVAVGQDTQPRAVDPLEQPVGGATRQLAVGGDVGRGDAARGGEHRVAALGHERQHPVDAPREVDRRGPGRAHPLDRRPDRVVVPALPSPLVEGEHDPHRPGDPERGRTPHGELADRGDQLPRRLDHPVLGASRQEGLVEQPQGTAPAGTRRVVPLEGHESHGANPTAHV